MLITIIFSFIKIFQVRILIKPMQQTCYKPSLLVILGDLIQF